MSTAATLDRIIPGKIRPRAFTWANITEDLSRLFSGVLNWGSFWRGYVKQHNPVEVSVTELVRDAAGNVRLNSDGSEMRRLKTVRRQKNIRNNAGGDWQARAMGGDVASAVGYSSTTHASTAATATTLTDAGSPAWTANIWAGHLVACQQVYGVVVSNTASVLTVDRWYVPGTPSGAAGTTPGLSSNYQILPGQGPMWAMALSTTTAGLLVTDVTASGTMTGETTTNGLARARGVFTHTNLAGGAGSTQTTTYSLVNTWTYTSSSSVTIGTVGILNTLVSATACILGFEALLSSTATVSANGDQITVTWTPTI